MTEIAVKTSPEQELADIKPEDVRAAFSAAAISARQFDLVTASRKLNAEETKRKVAALALVARWKRRSTRKYAHLSGADKLRKHDDKLAAVDEKLDAAFGKIDWKRRTEAETSLDKWLVTYCMDEGTDARFIDSPPSVRLREAIGQMQAGVSDASFNYHIRIARGFGKTSLAEGAIAYAAATGLRRFIVIVSAKADDAANIMEDVFSLFAYAPTFAQDYPEIAQPIAALNGCWRRRQTYKGESTKFTKSHSKVILPTILGKDGKPTPASGTIITARGASGKIRGLKAGAKRPDLLILDDLQDDEEANNEEMVAKAASRVRRTFMNLGGKRKLAAIMTSTPIQPDDLSETFAHDPAWKTTTYKAFASWPTEWSRFGEQGLWGQYRRIYQRELYGGNLDPHKPATAFYLENRERMDEGADVLDPNRYDVRIQESAVQALMDAFFENGEEAFEAEQQMSPRRHHYAFELTPQVVLSRVRKGVSAGTIIDKGIFLAAATDINPSYALTTCLVSFDINRTGLVSAYHVTPISISDAENDTAYHAAIYEAITNHAREVAEMCSRSGIKLDAYGIDAGGKQFDPVTRFATCSESLVGLKVTAMTGRAGQSWNPFPRSRLRAPLNDTVLCRSERGSVWLAWNADSHKESCQKAWGSEIGASGGLSLFDGGVDHTDFAIQVSNERLVEKRKRPDGRLAYKWKTKEPHDYLDCLAMCYALAGANGLGSAGTMAKTSRRKYVCF